MKKVIIAIAILVAAGSFASAMPLQTSGITNIVSADSADQLIAQYEKLAKKYIAKCKAAAEGDESALLEVSQIAIQLSNIYSKLSELDLTEAQMLKLAAVANKIAAAAASLQ